MTKKISSTEPDLKLTDDKSVDIALSDFQKTLYARVQKHNALLKKLA